MNTYGVGALRTSIKIALAKLLGELHKVALDESEPVCETGSGSQRARAANLIVVVVEPDDVDIQKLSHLARGTTNATSDIENAHSPLEAHVGGEVVFMPGQLNIYLSERL